jgi:PGF-pre-PGF domain-containing protein
MGNKRKLYSIALASIVSVCVLLTLISAIASAVEETRLSAETGEVGGPAIYGDKVVWSYWDKIHLYDLNARNDTIISMLGPYYAAYPAIHGDKIVWFFYNMYNPKDGYGLYVYDITTSEILITKNVSDWTYPDIYGNRFVWTENGNIYMYDISTNIQTQIPTNESASNPAIYDNKIVWVGHRLNDIAIDKNNNSISRSDIYMYDLSTKKEIRISTSGRASNPAIYGDRIVWQDSRNLDFGTRMGDIYMYDLSTEEESRISYSEQSSSSSPPAIYGDRIVWCDKRTGSDIYMYDLSTQKETQITTSKGAMDPDIYGGIIVDRDNREGLPTGDGYLCDIYMYNLTAKPIKPQAVFTSNVTSGNAPLTVLFTDTSTGEAPTSWYWDFGDGIHSKHAMNATHTFTKPGNYTISLTVENTAGNSTATKPDYIVVTDPNAPVADFNSNVTEGYAPLTVQFNDLSQKIASRAWDFNNDGKTDSEDINPIYTYTIPGTYTVNLTVSNENGTDSKTASISVLKPSSSSGSSSSSSKSSSSGGGGSPEPARNVQVKELSQAFITSGKPIKFDFTRNATCVVYIGFDSKRTFGKSTTIVEQLKGKSNLVSELPSGKIYKLFNVWVGNGGVATSKNIENPVVCFKVEKSWIKDKKIDPVSIALNRYNDKKWERFPVSLSGEDNKFLYFTAETSGFCSFAITGTTKASSNETITRVELDYPETVSENNTENKESQTEQEEIPSTSGFEIYCGVTSLFAIFLYKKK